MAMLIKAEGGGFHAEMDDFQSVVDDQPIPDGKLILSLKRFETDGEVLLAQGRAVGVRIEPDEAVEDLTPFLPRLAVVALSLPKFRDGRAFSSAHILRTRLGYTGQVRAVGEVLREQAGMMARCGFDAFEPSDGSSPEAWAKVVNRHRHVYQSAADHHVPAFARRLGG